MVVTYEYVETHALLSVRALMRRCNSSPDQEWTEGEPIELNARGGSLG